MKVGIYLSRLYIHFPLLIGFTFLGASIEHVVLGNQNLAMPFAEKWLLCISVSMWLFAHGVMRLGLVLELSLPVSERKDQYKIQQKYELAVKETGELTLTPEKT